MTRAWGNAAGRGRKCLLCKAELGTEDDAPDGSRPKGQARSRRSSQKDRQDELEECMEQISQAEAEVRAAAALLDDALECEEGTRKAMVRVAKTKLMSRVTTHLDVAKNLLHGEQEKGKAGAEVPASRYQWSRQESRLRAKTSRLHLHFAFARDIAHLLPL